LGLIYGPTESVTPAAGERLRLSGQSLRVPADGASYAVELGSERLLFCPEQRLDGETADGLPILVFNPERAARGIPHRLRLAPGEQLRLSYQSPGHRLLFDAPREAFRRDLQVRYDGDTLTFRDPIPELGTHLTRLDDDGGLLERRQASLRLIADAYGGPVKRLLPAEALDTLQRVNVLMRTERFRSPDRLDNPGALLKLPPEVTPILVADLHGKVDNLLRILSANGYVEAMARGDAAMILLGDAVHPEEPTELMEMDSSILIMDLIFKLKLRFPERFFFLIGNHDSYSAEVMKGGVPQGLLWRQAITRARGETYRDALQSFYQSTALVAYSEAFIACHASPPRGSYTRESLIAARQEPNRVHQITWDRARTPGFPDGYSKGDVRQLRRALKVDKETPLLLGHYPRSRDRTVWMHADHIPNHHIFYSAMNSDVSVFTQVGDEMVPQTYPVEPVGRWLNEQGWLKA